MLHIVWHALIKAYKTIETIEDVKQAFEVENQGKVVCLAYVRQHVRILRSIAARMGEWRGNLCGVGQCMEGEHGWNHSSYSEFCHLKVVPCVRPACVGGLAAVQRQDRVSIERLATKYTAFPSRHQRYDGSLSGLRRDRLADSTRPRLGLVVRMGVSRAGSI